MQSVMRDVVESATAGSPAMITSISRHVRVVTNLALRAACLFAVGLLLGFSGYTASAAGPHLNPLTSERSLDRAASQSQSPHLVAYSPAASQVRLR